MKQIAFYCHALGIGDILSAGPALKKVIKSYPDDTEFNIFTYHSYIFKHHPILNSFAYEEFSDIGYDEVFELFARVEGMVQNKYDSHIKHNQFDIRQVTAAEFGFTLLPEEMTCKYFPGKFDETKFKLPEKYIVMHCAQTWPSRTWPVERWQKLISRIEGEKNIPVVLVGRRIETDESTDPTKVPFDLDLSLGVDLVSKTTFDESWHIINNSIGVITNDSGILHIAGTTDVEIFYIGGSINPKLRMPYRKGTQEYKINFIGGECDIFCASDPKYSILEHGHFHSIPPLIHCLESYEKHGIKDPKVFECHPSTDRVFDIVKKFIPDSLPDLLELRYKEHSTYPKDIDEHLPILKKYALECDHITEMGVRCIVSTWALLMGKPKRLVSVDILHPLVNAKNIKCDIPHHTHSINEVEEVSKNIGCDFEFILENTCNPSFEIEETDLLFIDTLHCYEQLTRELELHADKVRKYIIFHDTEKFARNNSENWGNPKAVNPFLQEGTFISDKGLKNVVEEFLEEHKEWRIKKHYTNNNGLTILEKRNDKIVVVSTHFDHTNDKRLFTQTWMTVECIENFNNLGFEVIVASHSQIPKEVSDICKGTVVDEYNPSLRISREPDGSQCWWGDTDLFKVQHLNSNLGKNWSYGSYMNYYNGAEEAKKMGYERCLFTNYDIRIDDKFVEDLERFSYWYDGVVYNFNDVLNRENSKTYMYSGILYLDLEYYFKRFPKLYHHDDWYDNFGEGYSDLEAVCNMQMGADLFDKVNFIKDSNRYRYENGFGYKEYCMPITMKFLPEKNRDDYSLLYWASNWQRWERDTFYDVNVKLFNNENNKLLLEWNIQPTTTPNVYWNVYSIHLDESISEVRVECDVTYKEKLWYVFNDVYKLEELDKNIDDDFLEYKSDEEKSNKNFNFDTFILPFKNNIENMPEPKPLWTKDYLNDRESRLDLLNYTLNKLYSYKREIHIVETGTTRAYDMREGQMTLIFAKFIKEYTGGSITTIDISQENINICKDVTKDYVDVINYVCSDSVEYLQSMTDDEVNKIDLFYLDSYDLDINDPIPSQTHHLNELKSIYDRINKNVIIAVDDNFIPLSNKESTRFIIPEGTNDRINITNPIGKGVYIDKFLKNKGWKQKIDTDKYHKTQLLYEYDDIKINFSSDALGDTIAWIPYVEEYRIKNNVGVSVKCNWSNLFKKSYPEINFIDDMDNHDIDMGWSWTGNNFDSRHSNDYRLQPMQKTATDLLGLEYQEIKSKIDIPDLKRNIDGKYVCIAIHSTSQAKYWNNPTGWQEVVDFLKDEGYKIVCIDKYHTFGHEKYGDNIIPTGVIDRTGDIAIDDRIRDIKYADFFIGVGSGLSWLSWAIGTHVVMISGFSKPFCEFQSGITRIHNNDICNGCFNSEKYTFDRGNWTWCPEHENTDRMFECSKTITSDIVIREINKILVDFTDGLDGLTR